MSENVLLANKHVLVYNSDQLIHLNDNQEIKYVINNFCGILLPNLDNFDDSEAIIYLSGDIEQVCKNFAIERNPIFVIKEMSYNYNDYPELLINLNQVPINIHNVGVYFRNFFNSDKNYFDLISSQHKFQALTESNKGTDAFRTGIYLTKVEQKDDEVNFRLLRCSSNLRGPTDNFRDIDTQIVNQVNFISDCFFGQKANLNHVLAQIYENKIVNSGTKVSEKKAKIKAHSDKTKDMPRNGLIAFATFYKSYSDDKFNDPILKYVKKSKVDSCDYCFNDVSVFTKLRFKLKNDDSTLTKKFDVILYPNSVFIIPLSTNRLYTHEIVPPVLQVNKIPTRLGYVIRCSNVEAVYKNDQTYIRDNDKLIELVEPDQVDVKELRDIYFKENTTTDVITYDKFYFSLNEGDYEKPLV
jgi:hypothetical protein